MITLLIWCLANGFILHFDANTISDSTKMIIDVICIASDINLIASLCRGNHK